MNVAIICEGPTDKIIFDEIIAMVLGHRNFSSTLVQPLLSALAGDMGPHGGGWNGVLQWCRDSVKFGVSFNDTMVVENNDLVLIHLDADVSREEHLKSENLAKPCPPAGSTCDSVRAFVQGVLGGNALPDKLIICVPADSIEAWVVAGLAPNVADENAPLECYRKPVTLLAHVSVHGKAVGKSKEQYHRVKDKVIDGWSDVSSRCLEAHRFEVELKRVLA